MPPQHELLEPQPIEEYLKPHARRLAACVGLDPDFPNHLRTLCKNALVLHEKSAKFGLVSIGKPDKDIIEEYETLRENLQDVRLEIDEIKNHKKVPTELALDGDKPVESIQILGRSERRRIALEFSVQRFLEELNELCSDAEDRGMIRKALEAAELHKFPESPSFNGVTIPQAFGGPDVDADKIF